MDTAPRKEVGPDSPTEQKALEASMMDEKTQREIVTEAAAEDERMEAEWLAGQNR